MRSWVILTFCCVSAYACTCVSTSSDDDPNASAAVVFLGTVVESKMLPQHPEMKGRGRYVATFRVERYWRGAVTAAITLYYLEPGTDCLGGNFEVGSKYLVYAAVARAEDRRLDELFWYGWTDVLPTDTPMLVPAACTSTGRISQEYVKNALDRLGKGRIPPNSRGTR